MTDAGKPQRSGAPKAPRRRGRAGGAAGSNTSAIANKKEGRRADTPRNDDDDHRSAAAASANDVESPLPFRPHKSLLVRLTEQTPTWHECGRNTPGRDDTVASLLARRKGASISSTGGSGGGRNDPRLVARYRRLADKILEHEVALSRSDSGGSGSVDADERWVESTMRRGTLRDRIAAMAVAVGSDPVHKMHALDMLLNLAGCGVNGGENNNNMGGGTPNARVGMIASEALSDLFVNTLLPPDRKLVGIDARPLYLYGGADGGDEVDENGESVEHNNKKKKKKKKRRGAQGATEGDGSARRTLSPRILLLWRYEELIKIRYASYLSRYLGRTLSGANCDDQTKLSALRTASSLLRDVPEGEATLLSTIVNKIGDPSRKVAGAAGHQLRLVLEHHPAMVGVVAREVQQLAHRPHLSSRALYNCIIFLNQLRLVNDDEEEETLDEGGGGKAEKGVVEGGTGESDRKRRTAAPSSLPASLVNTYFRLFEVAVRKGGKEEKRVSGEASSSSSSSAGMKGRLLSALLTGVNRAHPYLPRKDAAMEEHVDALYRISHAAPPAAATQAFMLLFHLAVGSGTMDDGEDGIASQTFGRTTKGAGAAAAARRDRFYRALYSKVGDPVMLAGRKQLTMFFNLIYKAMKNDVDGVRVVAFAKRLLHTTAHASAPVIAGSLFLLSEVMRNQPALRMSLGSTLPTYFDPTKREPRAAFLGDAATASAEASSFGGSLWEASLIGHHYHPSVKKFCSSFGETIEYKGDPLRDFTLAPFLDKFAYRNPKSVKRISRHLKRGESVAERRSGIEGGVHSLTSLPMNDPVYLKSAKVAEEEDFFHKYFVERAKRDEIKGIVRGSGAAGARDADENDGEGEALEAAEGVEVDHDFGEDWDTDPEEEEFANALAEKLMESAGNGKSNFDDEDPDMEGWSDLDDDDEEDAEDGGENDDIDYSAMDGFKSFSDHNDGSEDDDDDDDFHKNDDDSASSLDQGFGSRDADAFMDSNELGSDEDDADDNNELYGREEIQDGESDEDSGDNDLELALAEESESDEEEAKDAREHNKKGQQPKGKKKEKPQLDSFADASEYEELIERGWSDRTKRTRETEEDQNSSEGNKLSSSSGGRKRRKTKRKSQRRG